LVWKVFDPSAQSQFGKAKRMAGEAASAPVSTTPCRFATLKYAEAVLRPFNFDLGADA
jgi:hypothetical protein